MPAAGDFTDTVRALYVPVAAEPPHRIANDPFQRRTGVVLSSREAQILIGSTVWGMRFFPCVLVLLVGFIQTPCRSVHRLVLRGSVRLQALA